MDFDPDKYLSDQSSNFDPDKYISDKTNQYYSPSASRSSPTEYAKKVGRSVGGLAESGVNLFGSAVGIPLAAVGGGMQLLNDVLAGKSTSNAGDVYNKIAEEGSQLGTTYAKKLGLHTEEAEDYTSNMNDFINRYLIALGPTHIPAIEGAAPGAVLAAQNAKNRIVQRFGGASADRIPVAEPSFKAIAEKQTIPETQQIIPENPGASAFDKIAESQISGAQSPMRQYADPMEQMKQQLDAQRQTEVQQQLNARQAQMEQDVARQQSLDFNAAERARQEQAPIPGLEESRQRAMAEQEAKNASDIQQSIDKTQELNTKGQQMNIVEDYGNNDPMARMPEMRVDENGIPIRADLSMEAQNLQNPLQRNLWGDELPGRTGDNGLPLTQALDRLPPGSQRDAAISMLSGQGRSSGQKGAINFKVFEDGFEQAKKLLGGVTLHAKGNGSELEITARDKNGEALARTVMSPENWANPKITDNAVASWTESRQKGLAQAMYQYASELGNDIVPSKTQTAAGKDMWSKWEKSGFAKNNMIQKQANEIAQNSKNLTEAVSNVDYAKVAGKQAGETMSRWVPEAGDYLIKPDTFENVKESITNSPDLPEMSKLRRLTLSGMELTGEMMKSPAMQWTSKWTQWAQKVAERNIRNIVKPLEHSFYELKQSQLNKIHDALLEESKNGIRFTEDQLREGGLGDKSIEAVNNLRNEFDNVFNKQLEQHEALGWEPLSKQEAYLAAMRSGDYHIGITTKEGQPIWYSRFPTRREANKALDWIKGNVKHADIDPTTVQVQERSSNIVRNLPRDILAEYQEVARMIDSEHPASQAISQAIKDAQESRGYTYLGQNQRFMKKIGVPGFEGDMPWLSEKENATRLLRAQLSYLENAHRWTPMQEALSQVKQLFADTDFNQNKPNTALLMREQLEHVMGINKDPVRDAERYLAKTFGREPGSIAQVSSALKSFNSLQKLSGSAGYILSTILQPGLGLGLLSREVGLNTLHPAPTIKAMADITAMMANSLSKFSMDRVTGGNYPELPLTKLGQFAKDYMDSAGSFRNILDTHHELGSNPVINTGRSILNASISVPEQIARTSTTVMFAHHLENIGYAGGDMMKIMQRAEQLSNMTNTNYRRGELPMLFNSAGSLSSIAGQFKAPAFNFYNQLHGLSRDAIDGVKEKNFNKVYPLLALMGATVYLAGIKNIPGVQETDGGWNLIKDGIAKWFPQQYSKVMGLGLRNAITNNVSEAAANGAVSHVTGASMGSRFSPYLLDVENPFKNALPALGPELSEWTGAANIAADPFNKKNLEQFGYSALANPMMKGFMENQLQDFQSPFEQKPGMTGYRRATNIKDPSLDYVRNEQEKNLRYLGLRSIKETDTREQRYAVSQESQRVSEAYNRLVRDLSDAVLTGDKEKAAEKSQAALRLIPDGNLLKSSVQTYAQSAALTPEQRELVHANNVKALQMYLSRSGQSLNGNK